jgi:hypothetical protein
MLIMMIIKMRNEKKPNGAYYLVQSGSIMDTVSAVNLYIELTTWIWMKSKGQDSKEENVISRGAGRLSKRLTGEYRGGIWSSLDGYKFKT